jgi:hypothetical protein
MAATEALFEPGNLAVAMTTLGQEASAAAGNRIRRSDQLSGDSQAMWAIAMTTPTNLFANALRIMNESGSGRTRAETNLPANTAAAGAAG